MNKLLFSILVLLTIVSCGDDCNPETTSAIWEVDKEITIQINPGIDQTIYTIEDGDKILFTHHTVLAQCDDILDDGGSNYLYFAIDKNLDAFEYSDTELLDIACHYEEKGASSQGAVTVSLGTVKGTKTSDTEWEIDVSIMTQEFGSIDASNTIEFVKTFTKED